MNSVTNSKLQIKLLEGVRSPQDFEDFRSNLLKSNKYKLEQFLQTHIEEERGRLIRSPQGGHPLHKTEGWEHIQRADIRAAERRYRLTRNGHLLLQKRGHLLRRVE